MIATCPRLGSSGRVCCQDKHRPPLRDTLPRHLGVLFTTLPRTAPHTASVAILWVIWKVQNAMVFNVDHQDAAIVAQQLQAHLHLWFCRS
jgi:hypothetical protein